MGRQAGGPPRLTSWKGKSLQTCSAWQSLASRSFLPQPQLFTTRDLTQERTETIVPSTLGIIDFQGQIIYSLIYFIYWEIISNSIFLSSHLLESSFCQPLEKVIIPSSETGLHAGFLLTAWTLWLVSILLSGVLLSLTICQLLIFQPTLSLRLKINPPNTSPLFMIVWKTIDQSLVDIILFRLSQ